EIAGATNAVAANLQGGPTNNYTVLVTNQDNGCQSTATVLLTDESELPVLSLVQTPNSVCDPSLAASAFNGTITATVTNQLGGLTDYTFTLAGGTGVA